MKSKTPANRLTFIGTALACLLIAAIFGAINGRGAETQKVVTGNNAFALDLYGRLRAEDGNICFSPYSISLALAMASAGARGETAQQMTRTLHLDLPTNDIAPAFAALADGWADIQQKGQVKLAVANSLWPQAGFELSPDYLALCDRYYHTSITSVDYVNPEAASKTINDWVAAKTNGKITDLLSPGAVTGAKLTLVNAIYFKGNWINPFKTNATADAPFRTATQETVTAPLMQQTSHFGYAEFPGLQVLELPYLGWDVSMLVLLPRDPDGLGALEKKLTTQTLGVWTANLPEQQVKVFLPKFKSTSEFSLKDTLAALGMPDAFSLKADFSGMDGRTDLYISGVVHKAFVDVNETGTEAAAATGITMMGSALQMPSPSPPVFRADHPFVFLIRDNHSGSILFLGRVANPNL